MIIQTIKDGEKNVSILVKGFTDTDFSPLDILDLEKVKSPSAGWKGIRLDSITWVLQEKMTMFLRWENDGEESSLLLPLESRNSMRFDEGIPSPRIEKGWTKRVWLSAINVKSPAAGFKAFFILLDFDKQ